MERAKYFRWTYMPYPVNVNIDITIEIIPQLFNLQLPYYLLVLINTENVPNFQWQRNRVTLALQGELCFKTAGILCCCTSIYNIFECLLQKHILWQSTTKLYSLVLKLLIQCCKKLLKIIFMNSCYICEILWELQFLRSPAKEAINHVKESMSRKWSLPIRIWQKMKIQGTWRTTPPRRKKARKTYITINNGLYM